MKAYKIITNNPIIEEINITDEVEIMLIDGTVKDVLDESATCISNSKMVMVTDILGGRRLRPFPYLTTILKYGSREKDVLASWKMLEDYRLIDEKRKEKYANFDQSLYKDYMVLDQSLINTVIKNLFE